MTVFKHLATIAIAALAVLPGIMAHSDQNQGGANSCSSNEFWYGEKNCCLPHGGPPSPPTPPRGNDCPPSGYYWGQSQGCCVPNHPPPTNSPPPQCRSGWEWYSSLHMCLPGGSGHWKRHQKSRSQALCPTGLDACPISGLKGSSDYECLDTSTELESCGGCASTGEGQDCTAIKGAWNVGCDKGRCKVYTCSTGYLLSADSTSCVPLS
ncbi:hypothetical protein K435DRAFT_148722 [Dendrothele bispora CBS 962.96]|uniref:Protein CPL1-like domain-containing protein n=1 Tax=Dendrothele bispora (strain CBS 962.96) TaxID=1314807 RepID=A0A4S8MPJ8_DENBC|nr:hypothetical protein K435DRAFT_148722 [Dendrothele bispora CBS 962.96]